MLRCFKYAVHPGLSRGFKSTHQHGDDSYYHIVTTTSTYKLNRLLIFSSILLFYHTSSIHKDGTRSFFIRSPALSSRVVSSPGAVFWAFQIIPQDSFAGFLKKYFFDEARAMRVEWSQSTIEHLWDGFA